MPNNPADAARLQREIAALRSAIKALAALSDAQTPLRAQLAEKERELAALQQTDSPTNPPGRSHTLRVDGNARVGTAIAGDLHGSVIHTQQSGGVNFGSGNTIGQIGDIVAGDKFGGDKVLGRSSTGFSEPQPPESGPRHLQQLLDQHTRRLQALELQAAQTGADTRPHIITEIESIKAEIERLRTLLDQQ